MQYIKCRIERAALGILGALCLSLLVSCGSSDGKGSVTDEARKNLEPIVGGFLIEAQRAFEAGNYNMALALTDSAEYRAPDLADTHFLRSKIYTQINQLDVAELGLQKTLEIDPQYPGANFDLGLNSFRRGKLRDAIDYYSAEAEIGETTGLMQELGRAYAKLGEPDSAVTAYQRSIALDSTNTTAVMWLGQLYEEIGELDQAISLTEASLAARPGDEDYEYVLGSLLFRNGENERAAEILQGVADARPWHQGAQYNLAQALIRTGKEKEAEKYLARADEAQQLQQQLNEAQNDINRAPDDLNNWTKLGDLNRKSGQIDRAIEAYKVAVSMTPWNLNLQNNLAILMLEAEDYPGAVRKFDAIVGVDSTMTDAWVNLGVAYAQMGDRGNAESAWRAALRQDRGNRTARQFLSRLDEIKAP